MSLALGIDNPGKTRFYQGWYNESMGQYWPWESEWQKWTRFEWEELGNGENLYWAIMHTIDKQTEFGPDAPVNNYRLKGQGLFTEITLNDE